MNRERRQGFGTEIYHLGPGFGMAGTPTQHWPVAAIGRSEICQSIGVTVHSHYVENFEDLLKRGLQGIKKTQNFLNTLYILLV